MVPGPRLFRSRWTAILWGAGIIWMAVDIAHDNAPRHPAVASATTNASDDVNVPSGDDQATRDAINEVASIAG